VLDGAGELELSSGAGKSSFTIVYSIVAKWHKKPGTVETLAICNTPVELDHGRVFIIDLSSESPVVNQFDYPLPVPGVPGDSRDCDKKAQKVLDDLREAIATGHAKKRLLKLRPSSDKKKPNALENRMDEWMKQFGWIEQFDWLPDPREKKAEKGEKM